MSFPDAAASIILGSLQTSTLSKTEIDFFRKEQPLGITLFGRNIVQEDFFPSLKNLIYELQNLNSGKKIPFTIAIDQEGGRVARLKSNFPNRGPALHLFDGSETEESLQHLEEYGQQVGHFLKNLGIHINFAPVLDILTENGHSSIGDRVFGKNSQTVIKRAGAYLKGLQANDVLGCLKHFPGQGDGPFDTHLGKTIIEIKKNLLWERELEPFRALISKVKMVMASHCIYPEVCVHEASRSKIWLTEVLRQELGFGGIIVSDDTTMGAVAGDKQDWLEYLFESVMAGCDLILICNHLDLWQQALEGLRMKSKVSKAFKVRLEQAATTVKNNFAEIY